MESWLDTANAHSVWEARRKAGFTQQEVAAAAGCSQSTISRIESGKLPLTIELAERISLALCLPRRELMGRAALARVRNPEQFDGEVFARMQMAGRDFQGVERLAAFALQRCHAADTPAVVAALEDEVRRSVDLLRFAALRVTRDRTRTLASRALVRIAEHAVDGLDPGRLRADRRDTGAFDTGALDSGRRVHHPCDTLAP